MLSSRGHGIMDGAIRRIVQVSSLLVMLVWLGCVLTISCFARAEVRIVPVPKEIRSDHFSITINGVPAAVSHAVDNYYYLNFDMKGRAVISITAPSKDYWAKGVELQPWRLGIRPKLNGRRITFTLTRPEKLSISRPGDHFSGAEMLFLFANPPEASPPGPNSTGVRYYGPGVYHENIDAKSGDRIYLAPGAVVFGSLNIWGVHDVRVFGRGTIVYDGPQNPNSDEGWMHRRNWHAIVMDNARNIEVSGILASFAAGPGWSRCATRGTLDSTT
jgi:hypothetical protein